jgi:hypothetical protein
LGLIVPAAAHGGHGFAIEFLGSGQVFDHQGMHGSSSQEVKRVWDLRSGASGLRTDHYSTGHASGGRHAAKNRNWLNSLEIAQRNGRGSKPALACGQAKCLASVNISTADCSLLTDTW